MKILLNDENRVVVQSDIHKVLYLTEINNETFIKIGHRTYKLVMGELVEIFK